MKKQRILSLCMASLLALSLVACNSPTDEQSSTQPTAAPTPTPTPPIPFTDVAEDSPYYDAVVWAYENGVTSGDTLFEPLSACTRGQAITFMWRAAGSPEPQGEENPFNDVSPDAWYYKPALWAYENGVASGTAFNPGSPCTNAEALTFLWRAEGKPAASVYNSAVALAASGAYYSRPAAWAETNGLFAGTDFDPAAPCSRADLMTYLHWVTEEWTFAEEDQAVQAEFEQIINESQLYEVHGSGLTYADYVEVEENGRAGLLTVAVGGDSVIMTVYVNTGGHAEKYCEQVFPFGSTCCLYFCTYDNHICLRLEKPLSSPDNVFYKIENKTLVLSDSIAEDIGAEGIYYNMSAEGEPITISEAEYNAIMGKYANQRALLGFSCNGVTICSRGLLPSREEYEAALAKQWEAERDQVYAAVLNGDFSYFEGTYKGQIMEQDVTWTLNKNGLNGKQPFYITIYDNGVIHCDIEPGEYLHESGNIYEAVTHPETHFGEYYELYPAGVAVSGYEYAYSSDNVRMHYIFCDGGIADGWFTKVS